MSAFASVNVFSGIQKNFLFCSILVVTAILQVLIVQFGSKAFHVAQGGLGSREWMISIVCGVLSLPVQQLINVVYSTGGSAYKGYRAKGRRRRDAALNTRNTVQANGNHLHAE